MWIGALLTSTAGALGRLVIVGLLPNSLLVAFLWLLLRVDAFTTVGRH